MQITNFRYMNLFGVKFLQFVSRMRGVANCLTSHADENPRD